MRRTDGNQRFPFLAFFFSLSVSEWRNAQLRLVHPGPLLPNFLFPNAKHGPVPELLPPPFGAGFLPLPRPPSFLIARSWMVSTS